MPRARRARTKKSLSLPVLLSIFVLIGGSLLLALQNPVDSHSGGDLDDDVSEIRSLVSHPPIVILSNAEFATYASIEEWPGDGSDDNPYIIQGYEIASAASPNDAIRVYYTDVWFKVRNCSLTGGRAGVSLRDVNHASIENISCTGNTFGVYLQNSSWNRISGSRCMNCLGQGILLNLNSENNTIEDNVCTENNGSGIALVEHSASNSVVGNSCSMNGNSGIYLGNFANNSQVFGNRCDSNEGAGIEWWWSLYLTCSDNTCSGNSDDGIVIHSPDNTVEGNTCDSNGLNGIRVSNGRIVLRSNTCRENMADGIHIEGTYCEITDNICLSNELHGVDLNSSHDIVIRLNNCSLNGLYGMLLYNSHMNDLMGNSFYDNARHGLCIQRVTLLGGNDNSIYNNTFVGNNGATDLYNLSNVQAYDDAYSNEWSKDGVGNYWADWVSPDYDHDGIVDSPYQIDGGTSVDPCPLAETSETMIPEFPSALIPIMGCLLLGLMCAHLCKRSSRH